jgi:hypothetical protein
MKYRNTLIMVGVLAVLIVVAVVLLGSPQSANAPAGVWDYGSDTVSDIKITQDNGSGLELLLKGTEWDIVTGTQLLPAEQGTVLPIIAQLPKLQGTDVNKGSHPLSDYGLQPPPAVITGTFQSGKAGTLLVGDNVPGNTSAHFVMDQAHQDKVFSNTDNTLETLLSWITSPPYQVATPTPLPLAPASTPAAAPISGTNTLTNTGTITGTGTVTGTGVVTNTGTATGTGTVTNTGTVTGTGTVTSTSTVTVTGTVTK